MMNVSFNSKLLISEYQIKHVIKKKLTSIIFFIYNLIFLNINNIEIINTNKILLSISNKDKYLLLLINKLINILKLKKK